MDDGQAPKKKVGRPAKALGKRQSYAFRMNEPVRAVVAAAAEANGRSLSEEVEFRVLQSVAAGDIRSIIRDEIERALTKMGCV